MAYTGTYIYRSTDAGAPPLRGAVGRLTDLFQQVFVDGYNALTGCSVARVSQTATITKTSHGFVTGQVVRHGSFAASEYNIDAKVTVLTGSTYSFTVAGSPADEGAVGTAKMCPLDWAAYGTPGTNAKAWQMPAICTNQFWLAVFDNGSTSAAYGRVRGYETVTGLGTDPDTGTNGTNGFPTNGLLTNGGYIDKSSTANDTDTRAWFLISDRKTVHLVVNYAANTHRSVFSFGQLTSYKSTTDSYPTYIAVCSTTGSGGNQSTALSAGTIGAGSGLWFARAYGGAVGSVIGVRPVMSAFTGGATQPGATVCVTYQDPMSGGLLMQRMICCEAVTTQGPRGHWPGFWFPWHQRPLTVDSTFSGAVGSTIEGRAFVAIAGATDGQILFETRDGSYWD